MTHVLFVAIHHLPEASGNAPYPRLTEAAHDGGAVRVNVGSAGAIAAGLVAQFRRWMPPGDDW